MQFDNEPSTVRTPYNGQSVSNQMLTTNSQQLSLTKDNVDKVNTYTNPFIAIPLLNDGISDSQTRNVLTPIQRDSTY